MNVATNANVRPILSSISPSEVGRLCNSRDWQLQIISRHPRERAFLQIVIALDRLPMLVSQALLDAFVWQVLFFGS